MGDITSAGWPASRFPLLSSPPGGACVVLGLSRQWADRSALHPFRYGGASRPAPVPADRGLEISDAVARLVSHTGLRGLNSADFMVREDGLDPGTSGDLTVATTFARRLGLHSNKDNG